MTKIVKEHGSWESPVTPDVFSKGNCKEIVELRPAPEDQGVFWIEVAASTGVNELYFQKQGTTVNERWAIGKNIKNEVYGYGGGSFDVFKHASTKPEEMDTVVVVTSDDGLWEQTSKGPDSIRPMIGTQGLKRTKYGDLHASNADFYYVSEHRQLIGDREIVHNQICSIERCTKVEKTVVSGSEFYACPRVAPDFKTLTWMQWEGNNMPWDETSIWIGEIGKNGYLMYRKTLLSGVGKKKNYYNPMWSPDGVLYVIHDGTGWWNLYTVDLVTAALTNVYPVEQDIGYPLWQLGDRPFALGKDKIVLTVGGELILLQNGNKTIIPTPGFCFFSHLSIAEDGMIYTIAKGPRNLSTLLRFDSNLHLTVIREAMNPSDLASFDISVPELLTFQSDGVNVSGYFYPPLNRNYEGEPGALPPVILMAHGGPTACAYPVLDLKKQFYTSRGFAVFDVNYRGSSNFGSEFRRSLYGNWGVVDRDDMINAAKFLIGTGRVDEDKVCIMGSSAGGFLVLSVLMHSNIFKAAVSHYGVSDLNSLIETSHKFEKKYNEMLIAPLAHREVYDQRNPIMNVARVNTAIAFFHGSADPIVPPSQSQAMYDALRKNVPVAIQIYDGEKHGFKGEALRKATEGTYYFFCKVLGITPSVSPDISAELHIHNLF